MLTRIFGSSILLALSLALLPACTAHVGEAGEWLSISVQANGSATKTTLSDDGTETTFLFSTGDKLGFVVDGVLNNKPLNCTDGTSGSFSGHILLSASQAVARPSVDYYAYFPYVKSAGTDPSALTAVLPSTQIAPFDGQVDFLVADPITDRYDVDDFPSLNFEFSTHLFAIVKLSITNTNEAYAGEKVLSIGLKSNSTPLAGQFTFSAIDGDVDFTDDPNYLSDQVLVEYDTPPTLGTGTTHSVYAVVNPASYASGTLSLVVNTTNYIFTIPSTKVLLPKAYRMTALSTADIASASRRKRVRTIVLWGDSITGSSFLAAVRKQLGPNWNVVRSGVAGDTAQEVACRQGGLPLFTQETAFTIPASSEEYVYINDIYWYYNGDYGQATGSYTFRNGYTPEINPLIIEGVECEMSWDAVRTDLHRRLRRLTDGEPVEVPARSEVSTYGSRAYADVDAIVVYIGSNSRLTDEILIDIHNRMKAHLTNPEAKMFVLGFHQSPTDMPRYWSEEYVSNFTAEYGDYFIDQRTLGGGSNAIPLMFEIGQITDESQISETDLEYINRGDWPLSWFRKAGDVHPNDDYGAKVMAILLRRRMAELGLL